MTQRINTPTRTGASSGNLLDLIIQHEDDDPIKDVSVSDRGISDHHCLITATLQHQLNIPNTIWSSARNISKLNLTTFANSLPSKNVMFSSPSDDLDTFASQLETDNTHVLDVLAPIRKFAKRLGKHSSNLSSSANQAKQDRRRLERRFRRTRAESDCALYRAACRKANYEIRKSSV